jgi:hypothetical protein
MLRLREECLDLSSPKTSHQGKHVVPVSLISSSAESPYPDNRVSLIVLAH